MRIVVIALATLSASAGAFALACSNSGSSGNPCDDTGKALCAKAAACSAGNDAGVVFLLGEGGASGDISFDNTGSCELLFTLGCEGDASASAAFASACSAAVPGAQCGNGQFGGAGLIMPPACN